MRNLNNKIERTEEQILFEKEMGKWLRKTRLSNIKINPLTKKSMPVVTQSKLAKHLGVSFQQIQKYESGSNALGLFKFRQCCVFFNTDPRDVLETIDVEMWNIFFNILLLVNFYNWVLFLIPHFNIYNF